MRQKVISNQETEKDKVVNNPLEVELKWRLNIFELQGKILPDHGDLDILEFHCACQSLLVQSVVRTTFERGVTFLVTLEADSVLLLQECFSQHEKVWLMRR
jgi:hypothetical protein